MDYSFIIAIFAALIGLVIFIAISKDDLGVTYLKKADNSNDTLLGNIFTSFPGSNVSSRDNNSKDNKSNS